MSPEKKEIVVEKEEVKPESGAPDLVKLLKEFKGSPSQQDIEAWKQEHGEIFVSGFSETELFIFRPLTWAEHKNLGKQLSKPLEEGEEEKTEDDMKEGVVDLCLLWTSVPNYMQKGGTIPTLFEQVMLNSNFVNPQVALAFVAKL